MAWNKPSVASAPSPTPKKKPTAWRGAVAGGIVALAAIVAAVVIFSGGDAKPKAKEGKSQTVIKEVTPAAAPKSAEESLIESEEDPKVKARKEKMAKMTSSERLDYAFEEMKKTPIDFTTASNKPFATGTEQVMASIFTTKLGDMPPPLPLIPIRDEWHMAEILLANNPACEGDSDKVLEAKAAVEAAKKELRSFIKEGGDVTEFLEYYRGQLVQANQEWMESQKSVYKVINEDPGIAVDYVKSVNARLAEKGIKSIQLTPHIKDKIGWIDD